jgi:hypothetical protein
MKDKQWVQHISGIGEKYEVRDYDQVWLVRTGEKSPDYYLPKSEYRLCPPPEVWRDCIKDVAVVICDGKLNISGVETAVLPQGYRWKWTSCSFLSIEKKVS